jgi:outer membrane protein assembly factor BamE (lipoprotein component of BamABCDE complex)
VKRCDISVIFLFLACVCFCSCVTAPSEYGRPFDLSAVHKIQKGQTTEAEVLGLLGEPARNEPRPEGKKIYHYRYVKMGPMTNSVTILLVGFDKNGRVSQFDWAIDHVTLPD